MVQGAWRQSLVGTLVSVGVERREGWYTRTLPPSQKAAPKATSEAAGVVGATADADVSATSEAELEALRAAQKALGRMEKIWDKSSFEGPAIPQLVSQGCALSRQRSESV